MISWIYWADLCFVMLCQLNSHDFNCLLLSSCIRLFVATTTKDPDQVKNIKIVTNDEG